MLQLISTAAGALPDVMTMDAGYWSEENAGICADQGVNRHRDRLAAMAIIVLKIALVSTWPSRMAVVISEMAPEQ